MLPNHKRTNFKTVTLDIHFLMVVSSRWDFFGSTMVIKAPSGKKETCFPFFRRFWAIERRKINDCSKNLVRNDNFITRMLQYFVFMFVFWCHYIWKKQSSHSAKESDLPVFTSYIYTSSWKTNENSRHSTFSYIKKLYSQFHSEIFFKRTPVILFLDWM